MKKTGVKKSSAKTTYFPPVIVKRGSKVDVTSGWKDGIGGPAPLTKKAQMTGGNTTISPTFWYTPELTPESWLLPKTRQEVLKWVRIFFNLDPLVQSILMMHSQYPFSKFKLVLDDQKIKAKYEEVCYNISTGFNLLDFMMQASLSYWKFGEAVVMGAWDKVKKTWKNLTLLDPGIVEIKQDPFSGVVEYEMVMTTELKKLVEEGRKGETNIPQVVLDSYQSNKNVPLDFEGTPVDNDAGEPYSPPKVSHLARVTDPGNVRGTPPVQCLFKQLIYQDKVRLAQISTADRYMYPIEKWEVGHWTGDPQTSILPDETALENIRQMITDATQTPPFSIIYGPLLKYEVLGAKDKLLNIYDDLNFVQDQIMIGLGVNKNLVMGESPGLGNSETVALQRLIMSYQAIRDQFTEWMKRFVFLPIAIANDFKDPKTGNYILPEIAWEKNLNYKQVHEEREFFYKLYKDGLVSTKTLFMKLPGELNYETEMRALEGEVGTIYDKGDKRLPKEYKGKPGAGGKPTGAGDIGGAEPTAPMSGGGGGVAAAPEVPAETEETALPEGATEPPEGIDAGEPPVGGEAV